jgi:hypothetical protein
VDGSCHAGDLCGVPRQRRAEVQVMTPDIVFRPRLIVDGWTSLPCSRTSGDRPISRLGIATRSLRALCMQQPRATTATVSSTRRTTSAQPPPCVQHVLRRIRHSSYPSPHLSPLHPDAYSTVGQQAAR